MTEPRRWLILVHQLPPRPSNLRIRVWRRLQQIGAVVLRNSLYVLPSTDEAREDFTWVREEILASGGQVSVLDATAVDGVTDRELVRQFQAASTADYEEVAVAARTAADRFRRESAVRRTPQAARELRRLRERLTAIRKRDYFSAPSRGDAEHAIATLETTLSGPARGDTAVTLKRHDFKGVTWVTRPRPGIDRVASAWLIRRFIAPDARFAFAAAAAPRRRRVPFDMPGVDFGHHGAHCTFETLMQRFSIADPAVLSVSRVVHDLDLKESRYGMAECAAIGRIVDGLRATYADDHQLLHQGTVVIEALYQSFTAGSRARKGRRTTR